METVMYLGNLLGFVAIAILGGFVGKRALALINLVIFLFGLLLTIFAVNLLMGGIGLFFTTLGSNIIIQVCYIYVMETASDKHRQGITALMSAIFSVGALLNVLWFYLLPNFETVLIFFYVIPLVVIGVIFFFLVKDAPICMVSRLKP